MELITCATNTATPEMPSTDLNSLRVYQHIHGTSWPSFGRLLLLSIVLLLALAEPSRAAFIDFENCLSPNIIHSNPLQLQLKPLFVWASFDSSPSHNLNVTVYGNVAGRTTVEDLPGPEDPKWNDPTATMGKIVDQNGEKLTTLDIVFNVLQYTPYNDAIRFCNTTLNRQCPIAPVFDNKSL